MEVFERRSDGTLDGPGTALGMLGDALALLWKEAFGKGPSRNRARLVDDLLLCVLEDGLTPAERSLVAEGRHDLAAELRRVIVAGLEPRIAAVVASTLQRQVRTVVLAASPEDARDVLLVVLAPAGRQPRGTGAPTPDAVARERAARLQERARELAEETIALLAESRQVRRHRHDTSARREHDGDGA